MSHAGSANSSGTVPGTVPAGPEQPLHPLDRNLDLVLI